MRSTGVRLSGRPAGCKVQPVHGEQAHHVGVWNGCQDQDAGSDAPPRALPNCKRICKGYLDYMCFFTVSLPPGEQECRTD